MKIKLGDLVETHDNSIGMIIEKCSAADHLGLDKNTIDNRLLRSFQEVSVYKVLIHGTICYINETNIKGIVECEKKSKKL